MELSAEQQAQQKFELREKCRTDKLFLSQLLGYDFQPDVHTDLLAQYIPFDNTKDLFEQHSIKERLTLWSRGFYKTTSIIVEIVQLILNFPDVSIMIMQSTAKNTKQLLAEVKAHFTGGNPSSKLDSIFPEFCQERLGDAYQFTIPTRKRVRKDPTVFVASPKSVKAGLHPDVGFFDDLVTEVNYRSPDLMKKVIEDFGHYVPLINPGGYRYVTGTRYTFGDLYEHIIRNNDGRWQITVRDCWIAKEDGSKISRFPQRKLADGRTIGISVEMLEAIQHDNPETFSAQYLNRPISASDQLFPESLLMTRVITPQDPSFPALGYPVLVLDLAGSTSDRADHSVIMAGATDRFGRVVVTDVRGGAWTPSFIAQQLLEMSVKHRPSRILVEHTTAATFFTEHVKVIARDKNLNLPLDFIKVSTAKGAKYMRIAALQGRFTAKTLFFVAGLPQWDRLVEEFSQFPKGRHDDYPDTVGLLCQYFGNAIPQVAIKKPSMFDMIVNSPVSEIVRMVEVPQQAMTLGSDFA